MKRLLQSDAFGLAVGGGLLAALVLAVASYAWDKHRWAEGRLAELEPRYARLLGLEASAQELDAALAAAQEALSRHAYGPDQDATRTGNEAQQRVRDVFTRAGLEVVSTQVLPPREEGPFDRIPIAVRLEGELAALQGAAAVLPTLRPSLFVESFSVQTLGAAKADVPQRLGIQMSLFVLRRRT